MPKEFSEWEWDYPHSGKAEQHEKTVQQESEDFHAVERVAAWAINTPPVTYRQDWWRAYARPLRPSHDAAMPDRGEIRPVWQIYVMADLDRRGKPVPDNWMLAECIGIHDGSEPPRLAEVAKRIAEWQACCE